MKKTILASALTLSMTPIAHADFIGLYVGAYGWDTGYDGFLKESGDEVDVIDSMGIDDEMNNVVYVAFEHPIPALPNIKVSSVELKASGSNNLAATGSSFIYGDTQYSASIDSDFDFSFTDATLYYEILDNVVSLDLGLTARMLDGEATIAGNGSVNAGPITFSEETGEFDPTLPMLYAMVGADLPLTGLSLRTEINYLGFGGDETDGFSDITAYVNWESAFGLGIMAGYRSFSFEYEDEDDQDAADIDIKGAFLGLSYHF